MQSLEILVKVNVYDTSLAARRQHGCGSKFPNPALLPKAPSIDPFIHPMTADGRDYAAGRVLHQQLGEHRASQIDAVALNRNCVRKSTAATTDGCHKQSESRRLEDGSW